MAPVEDIERLDDLIDTYLLLRSHIEKYQAELKIIRDKITELGQGDHQGTLHRVSVRPANRRLNIGKLESYLSEEQKAACTVTMIDAAKVRAMVPQAVLDLAYEDGGGPARLVIS